MIPARRLFSFPNPVNEVAARTVAAGVVLMGLCVAVLGWAWVLVPVVAPRLAQHERLVPGPPKRFAQGIGVAFTVTASAMWLAGYPGAARLIVAMLVVAALLEAALGLCLGCRAFAVLMRAGVVPERVCEECNDLSLRYPSMRRTSTAGGAAGRP